MEKKGYYTNGGYMGMVNGKWQFFATEKEYIEFIDGKEPTMDDLLVENHRLKDKLDTARQAWLDHQREIVTLKDQARTMLAEEQRKTRTARDYVQGIQYRETQKARDILYGFAYEFKQIMDGKEQLTHTCVESWYAMTYDIIVCLEQNNLWQQDDYRGLDENT